MRYIIVQSTRIRYDVRTRSFSEGMNECRMIYSSIWFLDNKKKWDYKIRNEPLQSFKSKSKLQKLVTFPFLSSVCLIRISVRIRIIMHGSFKKRERQRWRRKRKQSKKSWTDGILETIARLRMDWLFISLLTVVTGATLSVYLTNSWQLWFCNWNGNGWELSGNNPMGGGG